MHFFYAPDIAENQTLDNENSQHCIKVLRHKKGDIITLLDGRGTRYAARITDDNPKKCEVIIVGTESVEPPARRIHLALAPTKNSSRTEWFVEKAVEIGVSEITFLRTENSERRHQAVDRLEKIAVSAMKQSQRAYLPTLNELTPFSDFVASASAATKLVALLDERSVPLQNMPLSNDVLLLVGPEGDFSENEKNALTAAGFASVLMGNARLRTETAGVVGCTLLNFLPYAAT